MDTNSVSSSHHSPNSKGVVVGLILIVAGVLILSFNFGLIDSTLRPILFSWQMIFVVLSLLSFSKRDFTFGLIWLIVGLFFLLPRIAVAYPGLIAGIDTDFVRTYWPVLLILLGLVFVFRIGPSRGYKQSSNSPRELKSEKGAEGSVVKSVIFGGSENIFLEPVFNGGTISAVFGGVVLDLRRTTLPEGDTFLDVDATFGGVEIYIPGEWCVETRFNTVLGGAEDNRIITSPDHTRKLVLQGNLIFGGCEIR